MRFLSNATLGLWLIATGLIGILDISFRGMPFVMGALALFAGVFVLARR